MYAGNAVVFRLLRYPQTLESIMERIMLVLHRKSILIFSMNNQLKTWIKSKMWAVEAESGCFIRHCQDGEICMDAILFCKGVKIYTWKG